MGYLELAKKALTGTPVKDVSNVEGEVKQGRPDLLPASERALAPAQEQISRLTIWAGDDPLRWKRLHEALLRMYAPVWQRVNSRDILVAWAGAWLALAQAKRELVRLEGLRHPLTERECAAKGSRQADVRFWGRVARRFQARFPAALAEDSEAAKVLVALMNKDQGSTGE